MTFNFRQVAPTTNCIKVSNFASGNNQICALNATYFCETAKFGLPIKILGNYTGIWFIIQQN